MKMTRNFSFIFLLLLLVQTFTFAQIRSNIEERNDFGLHYLLYKTQMHLNSVFDEKPISHWTKKNVFGVDINGVSYENWNAGGTDAISALFNIQIRRTYKKNNVRWNNELISRYGINVQKKKKPEKTEDRLEINSTFGFRTDSISDWFYSAKLNLRTQFSDGYEYPDRSAPISGFMAPGYLYSGIGSEFNKYGDTLTVYFSPATHKSTWVLNEYLANKGAFGVQPAVVDEDGNIIKPSRKFKSEFGILLTNEVNIELYKNIELSHRISFYTDYMNNFGNIDIDWDAHFNFKVNDFVKAKVSTSLRYDDDTKTYAINDQGVKEERGAKVQWMQKVGIGLVLEI